MPDASLDVVPLIFAAQSAEAISLSESATQAMRTTWKSCIISRDRKG